MENNEKTQLLADDSSNVKTKVETKSKLTSNNNFASTSNAALHKSFFETTDADFQLSLLDSTFRNLSVVDNPAKTSIINKLAEAFSPTKSGIRKVTTAKRFESYAKAFETPEARMLPSEYLCKVLSAALNALDSAENIIQGSNATLIEYTRFLHSNQEDFTLRSLLKDLQSVYDDAIDNKMASRWSNSHMSYDSNSEEKTENVMEKKKLRSMRNN